MNTKRKEKLGDFLLDVAKYILTAVLLATWFSDIGTWSWYSYILPIGAVLAATIFGLALYKDDNKKKRKENNL